MLHLCGTWGIRDSGTRWEIDNISCYMSIVMAIAPRHWQAIIVSGYVHARLGCQKLIDPFHDPPSRNNQVHEAGSNDPGMAEL